MSAPSPANRAEDILGAVLDLESSTREAFIIGACTGNPVLLAEVRALLAAHESMPTGFLAQPAVERIAAGEMDLTVRSVPVATPPLHAAERAGEMIGHYKLREQIGEGGFGTVWVADQEQPVRRRVALKIIKLGMDTKEVIARFEQERQALAMMDHPNIARVLDAGVTQTGRPYFVMELVRGVKITDYCDDKGLSTGERIDLFIHVCQAVQHAHQKGIIHRDLKPSNILVTINDGVAVPKVIDFGVAKATQGRLTDGTIYTQFQQMIGTPLYMSPEQAEMTSLDVDTRSDIYALGVLLYELLTGRTPIDNTTMAKAGMDEIRRLIREVDPPKPSARLKTLAGDELTSMAKRRHTDAAKLPGALRGDLDWIVMKCIEKDRSRRYDTANGLALDLQRHLKNEVVIARPPTTAYLLSKLIRRNKSVVAAGCTVALALIVGFAVSVWQARRANHEARRSAAAFDELRATAPAFAEQARGLAAKEQYADAIAKLDYAIKLRPDAAEFLVAKADLLQCQFNLAEAAAIYREALRVKPDHARALASAKLCDELLAAPVGADSKLTRESLGKLHLAMQKQQRPAAELLPVARLLGAEKEHLTAYWLDRLKDLPISAEKPLKDRLTVREDDLLELDLKGTKITSLEPLLEMAPKLGKLVLWDCEELTDFRPLREFRSLKYLDLDSTQISDLASLSELPRLEELCINWTRITDLSPLRGMKLKTLEMSGVRTADLKPLAGMPLKVFKSVYVPTKDFSPLKGAPLEECYIAQSPLSDLSFLSGAPLKSLYLFGCDGIRGLSRLSELRSLERLVLPKGYREFPAEELDAIAGLQRHPMLKWIQADPGKGDDRFKLLARATQSKEVFWRDWELEHAFIKGIRAAGVTAFRMQKLEDNTYYIWIEKQPLPDLSIFKILPISELWIGACNVTDLSPLAELREIRILGIFANPVSDLRPLRGMPTIEWLSMENTKVSDLSPLVDLPRLQKLYAHGCKELTDLSPLLKIPTLENLTIPRTARNIEILKEHPGLRILDFQGETGTRSFPVTTPEMFWKRWEQQRWRRALDESGIAYSASEDPVGNLKVTVSDPGFHDLSLFKGVPIRELNLEGTAITDLKDLDGLPLSVLRLGKTNVTDLTPLHGMQLKYLTFNNTLVTDLSPLEDMPLEKLNIGNTPVTNISVLQGMLLKDLRMLNCAQLTDISPLKEARELTLLTLPPNAQYFEFLRDQSMFPKLERLSYQEDSNNGWVPDKKAKDFWKEYDAGKQ